MWLHNFLTPQTQVVAVGGCKSEKSPAISRVPQGSVLGSLLFLVLMRDIASGTDSSHLSSFADDTILSHSIKSEADVQYLQTNLQKIFDWARQNNMYFNEENFELLRCGPDTNIKESTALCTGGGKTISSKPVVKCLGVNLSQDAIFKLHISNTTNKAKQMAGWVFRIFKSRDKHLMITLWKALVQPVLDYCSQLWSPHQAGDIQQLEAVQRAFTRKITGMGSYDY